MIKTFVQCRLMKQQINVVHLCSIVEYVSTCMEKKLKEQGLCLPEMSEGIRNKKRRGVKKGFAEKPDKCVLNEMEAPS